MCVIVPKLHASPGISRVPRPLQFVGKPAEAYVRGSPQISSQYEHMFDKHGMPLPHIHIPLLGVFFKTVSRYDIGILTHHGGLYSQTQIFPWRGPKANRRALGNTNYERIPDEL